MTDANGVATFTKDYPFFTYYVVEMTTPDGYLANDENITIEAKSTGHDVSTVECSVVFRNTPIDIEPEGGDDSTALPSEDNTKLTDTMIIDDATVSDSSQRNDDLAVELPLIGEYTSIDNTPQTGDISNLWMWVCIIPMMLVLLLYNNKIKSLLKCY